ncbi:MAG TPA: FAD-dependent oxidoreductase [Planctomycetota bacterium]|nr:FAD-dependent oxidoreductase [Planctomycetota bacterium]
MSEPATGPTSIDLLVVGAGPTGLMLALQLARRGLRPLIVDRNPGPARETRALGVQARTLEIYARLGLAGRALELGTRATGAQLWVEGRRRARVPLGDIGRDLSPFPFLLILGQDDNEALLREALAGHGVEVRWNTELVGLTSGADGVTATLQRTGGGPTEPIEARYLAGCDGSRSAVRERLGIEFAGAPYEQVFFVADTRVSGPMTVGELNVYLFHDGFHLFFPMRGAGHWRVVGILPPGLRGRDDLDFDAVRPTLHEEAGGERLVFRECTWFSTYRIHHRRAARFRQGRCFLLGDAAHIHSPVGAQGLNTGLQDAYNLAWKLALVLGGRVGGEAAEALLATYAAEREPVAERLLKTTDQAFRFVIATGGFGGFFRLRVMPRVLALAMRSERLRRLAFRTISQVGIRYPRSPLSQAPPGGPANAPRGGPAAGDRFPWTRLTFTPGGVPEDLFARLDDTRFTLLVFGQPVPPAIGGTCPADLLTVLVVPDDPANARETDRLRVPRPSFYLLRPDGHVGLAGSRLGAEPIARYLTERVGLRPAGELSAARHPEPDGGPPCST